VLEWGTFEVSAMAKPKAVEGSIEDIKRTNRRVTCDYHLFECLRGVSRLTGDKTKGFSASKKIGKISVNINHEQGIFQLHN
jgi:hypothetical protein